MQLAKRINLIVACQRTDLGISIKDRLPWNAPSDLKHFQQTTIGKHSQPDIYNALVMGRKTFDTLGKPLPKRFNYVVTRNPELLCKKVNPQNVKDIHYVGTLREALQKSTTNSSVDKVFVVGGEDIYRQTLTHWSEAIDRSWVTLIDSPEPVKCDRFFPFVQVRDTHRLANTRTQTENGTQLEFQEWVLRNPGEEGYLNLMSKILSEGSHRKNRTDIDTISLFGERLEFDISKSIPFLTTKRLAWKTMLRELLWFISGDTNNKTLQARNVHIWDGNSTREYLDSIGLNNREEGDLGPVYGWQWRHFGTDYQDCHTDYTGKGVDQLQQVVKLIREDPNSRRIILSAWNPKDQPHMALPPCHVLAQWYVRHDYLDCQMYQRSCDVALGVPFNIASYSVLTYMLAHITNLKPGRFIHIMGDTHIYTNHINAVKQQLQRVPNPFPTLEISRKVENLEDFKEEDFKLQGYDCHGQLKMDMAV